VTCGPSTIGPEPTSALLLIRRRWRPLDAPIEAQPEKAGSYRPMGMARPVAACSSDFNIVCGETDPAVEAACTAIRGTLGIPTVRVFAADASASRKL
jgi:hypothetical protein